MHMKIFCWKYANIFHKTIDILRDFNLPGNFYSLSYVNINLLHILLFIFFRLILWINCRKS